jgi:glycosyltransferase involved in cell wall biosynthesis
MRILILHSRYLSGPASGENRVVDDEVALLRQAGHTVHLRDPSAENIDGLGLARTALNAIWSRNETARVTELIAHHSPDVVHSHNLWPALSPAVISAAAKQGVPIAMTLHNYRLMCLPATLLRDGRGCEECVGRIPWRGVTYRCYHDSALASGTLAASISLHRTIGTWKKVSLFMAISKFVREKHIQGGLPAAKIMVKPHFVWPGPRREGPGDYFLYLGRLSPEKGVITLVETWREARAPLLIVGEGPQAEDVRAKASPDVEIRPTVPPPEVVELISRARAVVVPSVWYEGAGRVVLEAYASGVPVIASRIGALPEVVEDGVSGLLVPPVDKAAWVSAVERLLDDSESERLGRGGYNLWDERYRPDNGLANLERGYERLLARQP